MDRTKTSGGAADAQAFTAPAIESLPDQAPADRVDLRANLDVILDVPVTLSLEVGRARMNVGRLLSLTQGSVVELDRQAGEPLDVLVNGALVARGEIVMIGDKFGIRLTDVVPPARRVAGSH